MNGSDLEKELELQGLLLDAATDSIFLHDLYGNFIYVNDRACKARGYTKQELLAMDLHQLDSQDYIPLIKPRLRDLTEKGEIIIESAHVCKDGTVMPVEIHARLIEYQGRQLVLSIIRDITERKRSEEEQKSLERALAESVSMERRKVGAELHDGLGQILTGMAYMCKATEQQLFNKHMPEYKDLEKIKELLNEAIRLVKDISTGLIPLGIETPSLERALSQLAANTEKIYKIRCKFTSFITVPIQDRIINEELYFIACEALINAVKHGRAQNIFLTLRSGYSISLVIEDEGIGFPEGVNYNKGMGLRIMKYRAGIIGASLEISSSKDGKTTVSCSLNQ